MRVLGKRCVLPVVLLAWLPGCLGRARRIDVDDFLRAGGARPAPGPDERAALAADEAGLAGKADLAPILRLALARAPDVLEGEARVREAVARVPLAARAPDLELKYEQWGVHLARPWGLDDADAVMVGLRQTLPPPGQLGAQERAAREDAEVAAERLRAHRLDVAREVRRAWFEYFLARRERDLQVEHIALTEQILELTRSAYRAGLATEQDVLRVGVELARLRRVVVVIEQRRRSAAARLNSLMARPPAAPLGPAGDLPPVPAPEAPAELERRAERDRPELALAAHTVAQRRAGAAAARSAAAWPSFMVGADYMWMPERADPHGWGAMVSINLPWLNPARREEVRAADRATAAEERALDAARTQVRYEIADALARVEAARRAHEIVAGELLPTARQSFDAARAGFAAGRGDALALLDAVRSLLQVRLDEVDARVALAEAAADLDRAVGAAPDDPTATKGTNP